MKAIDDRGRLEDALRESEERFRSLFDGVPVALYRTTPDGEIVAANLALVEMLGFSDRAELLATNVRDLVVDGDRERERAVIDRDGRVEASELRLRRRDGRLIWVEDDARVVRDVGGHVVAYEGSLREITERKRAEMGRDLLARAGDILMTSLDYETTLASVADLAVSRLADYVVVDVLQDDGSPKRLAATHRDAAMAKVVRKLENHPPDLSGPSFVARALRTGEPQLVPELRRVDLVAAASDAEHLRLLEQLAPVSLMVVTLRARERTFGSMLFASADPEARYDELDLALAVELARRCGMAIDNARLYAEAQAAIRARDEFLTIASHELRTPVTGVKGAAQLLLRRLERGQLDPERLSRTIELIDAATDRLDSLTQDLLDVSRIRRGQLPLHPRPLDVHALVVDVVGRLAEHVDDRHRVVLDLQGPPPTIVGDAERLDQVVANLLQNAVKYSPDGGEVRVSCRADGDGVLIRVVDTGIGLPAGAAEGIFELFGRAANAMRMHLPGFGLGLHICRNIVERHGGRIHAESAGESQGTAVSVWLPRTPPVNAPD